MIYQLLTMAKSYIQTTLQVNCLYFGVVGVVGSNPAAPIVIKPSH